jgi:hypothetical protein
MNKLVPNLFHEFYNLLIHIFYALHKIRRLLLMGNLLFCLGFEIMNITYSELLHHEQS